MVCSKTSGYCRVQSGVKHDRHGEYGAFKIVQFKTLFKDLKFNVVFYESIRSILTDKLSKSIVRPIEIGKLPDRARLQVA